MAFEIAIGLIEVETSKFKKFQNLKVGYIHSGQVKALKTYFGIHIHCILTTLFNPLNPNEQTIHSTLYLTRLMD